MEAILSFLPYLLTPSNLALTVGWASFVYWHTKGHTIVYNPRDRVLPTFVVEGALRSVHSARFLFHKASEYTHTLGTTLNLALDVRYRLGGDVVDVRRRRNRKARRGSSMKTKPAFKPSSASGDGESRDMTSFDSILTDDED